jgi:hypothetical protein
MAVSGRAPRDEGPLCGPVVGEPWQKSRLPGPRAPIAHRLSTIRNADTIVVMDHGRIGEQGSHHDLLRRRGFYYQLYNSQFTEAMAEAS